MSKLISRTGRVQSWMDNPESRLPVSCTVMSVDDSMTGVNGIESSWRFVSHALRHGAGVAVHLSNLRPKGTVTTKGPDELVASGPVSFGRIYSMLNEVLRRGGTFRNGACVLHIDIDHPDSLEFIQTPRHELPWVKRCINLTTESWHEFPHKEELLQGIRKGDIWLNKIRYDKDGNRIRGNVCLEVYLPSRGTCLLQHVNFSTAHDIAQSISDGIEQAAAIAKSHNMVRAFAIAPTASCSYRSVGLDGFTACPEIAPPIGRTVDRDSGTFGVTTYEYGDVEIASEVGWEAYKLVADQLMTMLEKTGLLHGYSFNSWSDQVTYDNAFIEEWLASPQTSLYYSLQVMGDVQDKTSAYAALDESDVDDYLADLLTPEPQCDCAE
jgi:hypothetical protein